MCLALLVYVAGNLCKRAVGTKLLIAKTKKINLLPKILCSSLWTAFRIATSRTGSQWEK